MEQTKTQKYTLKDLASEFGVSKPTVVNILAKNEIGEIAKFTVKMLLTRSPNIKIGKITQK